MTIAIGEIQGINSVNVLTERVKKRNDECVGSPLWISSRRTRSFTESWKSSGSESNPIRWGLAMAQVFDESPIVIRDGELIVGSETKYVRGAEISPEQNPDDILKQMEDKSVVTMSEVMFA